MASPALPTRFPCWVQAVYSWGGESKKDLGFMEGDLIECLNAGDGSWWMGRLKRDRRAVGLFPSNFVKLLDEDFFPVPKMSRDGSASQSPAPLAPSPQKAKYRKPYTAMAISAPGLPSQTPSPASSVNKKSKLMPYSSMKKDHNATPSPKPVKTRPPSPKMPAPIARGSSPMPYSGSNTPSRAPSWTPSYAPSQANSRASSPAPQAWPSRHASPAPPPHSAARGVSPSPGHPLRQEISDGYYTRPNPRTASPLPPQHHDLYRASSPNLRAASPYDTPASYDAEYEQVGHYTEAIEDNTMIRYQDEEETLNQDRNDHQDEDYFNHHDNKQQEVVDAVSPPPPPPPAHTVAYTRQPSPLPHEEYIDIEDDPPRSSRSPAPSERSRAITPSPLRDAMNDVMSSLEGMSMSRKNSTIDDDEPVTPAPAEPENIWSPEAFGEIYAKPTAQRPRPKTANSFRSIAHDEVEAQRKLPQDGPFPIWTPKTQPKLESYVERMEKRLSQIEPDTTYDFTAEEITSSPPSAPSIFRMPGRSRSRASKHASSRSESHAVSSEDADHSLQHRKSAYELGKDKLKRTFSTKSTATTASSVAQSNTSYSTQATSQSLMSGYSAGGFSATSAGSLARRQPGRSNSIKDRARSLFDGNRPGMSMSGVSYHSSHASGTNTNGLAGCQPIESTSLTGFAQTPVIKKKKSFVKSLIEKAKTSAASARSTVSTGQSSRPSPPQSIFRNGATSVSGPISGQDAAKEMGLGGSGDEDDWMQMRRDVNRSNSLSRNERNDRAERCQMMDMPVIAPVDILHDAGGDESVEGYVVNEPTDFTTTNLAMVDKNARFVNSLPGTINAVSLAQGYLCRPYRSEVQRLRAIFIWVSERIGWEEDYEGEVDTRRVIQTRRGCSREVSTLVAEMCESLGIYAEIVQGHLKTPGEALSHDLSDISSRPNHWWNAIVVEGEWRIMDCSLASPSNPRRSLYSSPGNQVAESFWFLTRPMEACYTHVPPMPEQQHIIPCVPSGVLAALPVAGPGCFNNNIRMWDFDTSLLHLDGLEMAHIQFLVPEGVECTAEVEARGFARDVDGDLFESGDIVRGRALAQAEFVAINGTSTPLKRYTVRALVPPSANSATLKIYAGRKGLQHSINSNPHSFALALPLSHQGVNSEYDFFSRHPTPHALRHELYITGPLCRRLVCNNTVVFSVRQHAATTTMSAAGNNALPSRPTSALSTRPALTRPVSSMSIASISVTGSNYSDPSTNNIDVDVNGLQLSKPAKLAVQTPSGKIIRMTRKIEPVGGRARGGRLAQEKENEEGCTRLGSTWETIVKISEKGTWRGLVLADRSARWCVFGEWMSV